MRYDYNIKFKLEEDVEKVLWGCLICKAFPGLRYWWQFVVPIFFFFAHTGSERFHLYTGLTHSSQILYRWGSGNKRDWALLTAHSWRLAEPDSSLSRLALRLMLFPLLHWPTTFFFFKLHLVLPQKFPVLILLNTEETFTGHCSSAIVRIVSFSQTAWIILLM